MDVLKLLGKGSGGIDEVNVHSHQEDMQVMYGLGRWTVYMHGKSILLIITL